MGDEAVPNARRTGSEDVRRPRRRTSKPGKIDTYLKVFGVLITIWAAYFANTVQERLTGTSLLSQREQAESQLRAQMFGDLIGPIAGQPGANQLDPDRERLLAELLTLNFHEHFEFKPLLLHADARLGHAGTARVGPTQSEDARASLRSVARRVASRQIASLLAESWNRGVDRGQVEKASLWPFHSRGNQGAASIHLLKFAAELSEQDSLARASGTFVGTFEGDGIVVRSPDGADSVSVTAHDPNWIDGTVKLDVQVWEMGQGSGPTSEADFTLTWYDFPLTDNTLLKDGNRFSFVLKDVRPISAGTGIIHVELVWFPQGYFTPRERPINQRELQGLVGKKLG